MIKKLQSDILIYNLEFKDIKRPFTIDRFTIHPKFNLEQYLREHEEDKVRWVIESQAKYACYKREIDNRESLIGFNDIYHTEVQLFIAAFRLLKAGCIQLDSIMTNIRAKGIEIIKDLNPPPVQQLWSEPIVYELYKAEIPLLRSIHKKLKGLQPGYLDVAIKRFNRSYDYWAKDEIDDCFADLVIALESLTSRGGDGILQSMKLRIPLLLRNKYKDRKKLESEISTYYDHRSSILHGGRIDEKKRTKREALLEDLRELVRNTIVSCMKILEVNKSVDKLQKTMAETIDSHLHIRLAKSK